MSRHFSLAAAAIAGSTVAYAANPAEFLVYNYDRYDNGISTDSNDLVGRLFVPANYDPNKSYPLVTFLHGNGERRSAEGGAGNTWQVNGNIDNLLKFAKSQEFIIYAPQCWGGWGADHLNTIANQIAKLTTEYSVDQSRMYITGLSLGGGGTMDIAGRYSHIFAAAVNICGVSGSDRTAALATLPIWMHHARNDSVVDVNASRNRVNNIRTAKGLPTVSFPAKNSTEFYYYDDGMLRYSEYGSGDHYIWGSVYNNPDVYDWMLSKTKTIPTIQPGDTLLFDVGATEVTSTVNGQYWNSTNYGLGRTTAAARSFARTSEGYGTNVTLWVDDPFPSENTSDASPVNGDGWLVSAANMGVIRLSGLDPTLSYMLEIFGSSTSSNSRTRYAVGSEFYDLITYNNSLDTVVFPSLVPDSEGNITLTVSVAPGGGSGIINWMSLTAVPEPGTLGLIIPMLLGAGMRRRRHE